MLRDAPSTGAPSVRARHGRLAYESIPAVCTASGAWLDSAQASAYGAYDFVGASGVVRVDKSERTAGRFQLELEWSE